MATIDTIKLLPKTADAYFEMNNMIAFIAKANTSANVAITTEKSEKRGGQNNALLATIYSDRAVEVTVTAVDWQPEFLAASIGTTIAIGTYNFKADETTYIAVGDGTPAGTGDTHVNITLPDVPVDQKITLKINGEYVKIAATTTTVDVKPYGFVNGDCVSVLAVYAQKGRRVGISTNSTPSIGKLTLSSPLFTGGAGEVGKAEYVFPSFQFDGNFTHDFSADANFELKGTALSSGGVCGSGTEYGFYQEYILNDASLNTFSSIVSTPTIVELDLSDTETQQITTYGVKNDLYDRVLLENNDTKLTYVSGTPATCTVSTTGLITPVAVGTSVIIVTYDSRLTAAIEVTVVE